MCSISVREAATFLRRSRIDRRREKWPGVAPTVNRMKDEGRRERANSPPTFLSPTPSLPRIEEGPVPPQLCRLSLTFQTWRGKDKDKAALNRLEISPI